FQSSHKRSVDGKENSHKHFLPNWALKNSWKYKSHKFIFWKRRRCGYNPLSIKRIYKVAYNLVYNFIVSIAKRAEISMCKLPKEAYKRRKKLHKMSSTLPTKDFT